MTAQLGPRIEDGHCVIWIDNSGRPRMSGDYATDDLAMNAATLIQGHDIGRRVLRVMSHAAFVRLIMTPTLTVEDTGL